MLGCFVCATFGDCGVQGEALFFQKILNNVSFQEASNNLVTEVLLGALLRTENRFSLVLVGKREIVERFSLLDSSTKVTAFYRFVYLTLYVLFDGRDDVVGSTSLFLSQLQVVDDRDGLSREAQCECLNLLRLEV